MAEFTCPQCGAPLEAGAIECKYCGEALPQNTSTASEGSVNNTAANVATPGVNPTWPERDKTLAGILAILLGGIGVHQFYLGRTGKGILFILFCWTGIPAIIGLIQGIILLTSKDEDFMQKYHVRQKNCL